MLRRLFEFLSNSKMTAIVFFLIFIVSLYLLRESVDSNSSDADEVKHLTIKPSSKKSNLVIPELKRNIEASNISKEKVSKDNDAKKNSSKAEPDDSTIKRLLDNQLSNEERRKINSLFKKNIQGEYDEINMVYKYDTSDSVLSVAITLIKDDGSVIVFDIVDPLPMIEEENLHVE